MPKTIGTGSRRVSIGSKIPRLKDGEASIRLEPVKEKIPVEFKTEIPTELPSIMEFKSNKLKKALVWENKEDRDRLKLILEKAGIKHDIKVKSGNTGEAVLRFDDMGLKTGNRINSEDMVNIVNNKWKEWSSALAKAEEKLRKDDKVKDLDPNEARGIMANLLRGLIEYIAKVETKQGNRDSSDRAAAIFLINGYAAQIDVHSFKFREVTTRSIEPIATRGIKIEE